MAASTPRRVLFYRGCDVWTVAGFCGVMCVWGAFLRFGRGADVGFGGFGAGFRGLNRGFWWCGVVYAGLRVQRVFVWVSPRLVRRCRLTAAALVVSHCLLRVRPRYGTRLAFPRVSQAMVRSTSGLRVR